MTKPRATWVLWGRDAAREDWSNWFRLCSITPGDLPASGSFFCRGLGLTLQKTWSKQSSTFQYRILPAGRKPKGAK